MFIQFSFIWIMQIMSRIRGKKSGLSPQRFRWVFSEVDFAFLWAGIIFCLGCPMFEWVTKLNISAGFLSVGWENFLVGNLCWFFIFILIRLTVFLQSQRYKFKLLTLAMAFFPINECGGNLLHRTDKFAASSKSPNGRENKFFHSQK